MKLALCALLAFVITGCVRDSINIHREAFEPSHSKGAWNQLYRDVRNGKDPSDSSKRPLYSERVIMAQ